MKKLLTIWISALLCLSAQAADTTNGNAADDNVNRFNAALQYIQEYHVNNTEYTQLFDDAIQGMLSGLDPHSSYLTSLQLENLLTSTTGEFGGIGIEIIIEKNYILVISPIDDTPAAKAGIKPSDIIIKLDDQPVQGMSSIEVLDKIRGKKGSRINLTVLRQGENKPLEFTITRDIIKLDSVKYHTLPNNTGYLRISSFQETTARDAAKAIEDLVKQNDGQLQGLIIDLRNNPGGLLESAIAISDFFLDAERLHNNSLIVYSESRLPDTEFAVHAKPGELLAGIPIVVLINQGSASGAEIVAGAIQDHQRGIIVGVNSFGKGSVQTVFPLDDKHAVKLTTALYYTPLGRSIQATGIQPDIVIPQIQIPETAVQESNNNLLNIIQEVDLSGHLPNSSELVDEEILLNQELQDLLMSDFQLYSAWNILKTLQFVQ